MLEVFAWVVRCDVLLAMRRRADVLTAMVFFVVVVSLFPLATSPDPSLLRKIAPGVIWVAALLSSVLTLPRVFASELNEGTLDRIVLAAYPLTLIAGAKIAAHWLTSGLPLVVLSPLLALQFDLAPAAIGALVASLLAGTVVLSAVGAIGAALTLGARSASLLLALIVLPLYVPVLVLGCAAVEAAASGLDTSAHFMLLGALLLTAVVLAPWAAAGAVKGVA